MAPTLGKRLPSNHMLHACPLSIAIDTSQSVLLYNTHHAGAAALVDACRQCPPAVPPPHASTALLTARHRMLGSLAGRYSTTLDTERASEHEFRLAMWVVDGSVVPQLGPGVDQRPAGPGGSRE